MTRSLDTLPLSLLELLALALAALAAPAFSEATNPLEKSNVFTVSLSEPTQIQPSQMSTQYAGLFDGEWRRRQLGPTPL